MPKPGAIRRLMPSGCGNAAGLACNHGHGALAAFGLKHAHFNQIRHLSGRASAGHASLDPLGSRLCSMFRRQTPTKVCHPVTFSTTSPPLARALAERNYDQPTAGADRRAGGRRRRPRPAGFGANRLGQDRRLWAGHCRGSSGRCRAVRAGRRTACPDRRADARTRACRCSANWHGSINMRMRAWFPASAAWIRAASSASLPRAPTSWSARRAGCAIICGATVSTSRN